MRGCFTGVQGEKERSENGQNVGYLTEIKAKKVKVAGFKTHSAGLIDRPGGGGGGVGAAVLHHRRDTLQSALLFRGRRRDVSHLRETVN